MAIDYQHITGGWKITDYDSRTDDDPFPDESALKGRVVFVASFDAMDRFAAIRVPGAEPDPAYALSVRPMVFPVVAGRLQDRQARDGAWLPAVVAGVPIVWTATPEVYEDPGRGVLGDRVPADSVTFAPAAPGAGGIRELNLADVLDAGIEYPEPVVSRVAELVRNAEAAARSAVSAASAASEWEDFAQVFAEEAAASAAASAASETAAALSAGAASGSASSASGSAAAAAGSAAAASGAGAARDAAQGFAATAGAAATAAAGSAAGALASAGAAATSATDAGAAAVRAEAAADAAETGAPAGGWVEADLSATVRASLGRADGALLDELATVTLDNLAPEVSAAFGVVIDDAIVSKADLGPNGKIVTSQIPALAISSRTQVVNRAGLLAIAGAEEGDVGIITAGPDRGSYMLGPGSSSSFASWALLVAPEDLVSSVNGQVGPVNLGAADVGAAPATHGHAIGEVSGLQGALDARLPAQVVNSLPASPTAGVLYLVRKV